ncbi:hypothetical protein FE236_13630 [Mariprofundus erugo]|uniref:hypothetical protein n=1 Tax=Mariprofundus erugo TaxID=2528639 RepID=UPI0010FDE392|nr:hypothetical protein [Mariprofundus erugo]TLS71773.1 hypothetical protein FE236_13630 [Mariprofundus erugo]
MAYGTAGGVSSVMNGGTFGVGFVTAAVPFVAPHLTHVGDTYNLLSTISDAVVGGTVSKMMGGTFEQGAMQAGVSSFMSNMLTYARSLRGRS